MLNQYYILYHIINELRNLIGYGVGECFSQEKETVDMVFSNGTDERYMHFSADGFSDGLFLREHFARAKRNTKDVFPILKGETLQNVSLINNDRIVKFEFIYTDLYAVLFGRGKSNIYICSRKRKILDTMKDTKDHFGKILEFPTPNLRNIDDFASDTPLKTALTRSVFMLTDFYAGEIITRLGIFEKIKLADLEPKELSAVKSGCLKLVEELKSAKTYYILADGDSSFVSLIPLKKYPEVLGQFTTLSEAVQRVGSNLSKQLDFGPLYKQLQIRLARLENKLLKKITDLDEQGYFDRAEQYNLIGALLASSESPKLKGIEDMELLDYSGEKLQVKLDSKKTIIENSEKYFKKSKKTREELKVRKAMIPKLENELTRTHESQIELQNTQNMKQLEKLYMKLGRELGINFQDNKMERADKFRKFELDEGFVAYAGKNAANNDELTMKFAKPNDMWLHARGSSGSHVVVPLNKDQKLPKKILEQAAGVAAYYSGSKNAKYTPVAYCLKKYVRKPKGANPGAVLIARENVIMAEPKLPQEVVSE